MHTEGHYGRVLFTLLITALITSTGCNGDETSPTESGEHYVIPFIASVNELPLNCGQQYDEVGTSRSSVEIRDFRFYVYDVQLVDAEGKATPLRLDDGNGFQLRYTKSDGAEGGLALLDFTDTGSEICAERGTEETNTVISGVAPEGDYQALLFTLGVPPELNHINAAVSEAPLNTYGMQWTWASGYRYVKTDLKAITGETEKDWYYFHPGAQGCVSDNGEISGNYECENPLTSAIELAFEASHLESRQAIQADLGRLLSANDLSLGRGCMGARTLSDPAVDGFGVDPTDGCPELYAAVGVRLPSVVASQPETMGQCSQDQSVSCSSDEDCIEGMCFGYQPAVTAEPADSIAQTLFTTVDFDGTTSDMNAVTLDDLSTQDPLGWPHPDYQRNEGLNISAISQNGITRSHPPEDPRYGANCMKCHQDQGPGLGKFAIGGTIYAEDDGVYTGGGYIEIGTGIGNRFGPRTHPIADKIKNWTPLFTLPIDAHGQFYASADQANGLDYAQNNYFARLIGSLGQCKSLSGQAILDENGAAVACESDVECESLSYEVLGTCKDALGAPISSMGSPVTCTIAEDCGVEGATCEGYEANLTPICDKLLNAMAVSAHGACNHCHQSSFKIRSVPTL